MRAGEAAGTGARMSRGFRDAPHEAESATVLRTG